MFAIGDKVQWTEVKQRRNALSMYLREGEVVKVEGDEAVIKTRQRGGYVRVGLVRLQRPGEKSQISEFVEVMRSIGETFPHDNSTP